MKGTSDYTQTAKEHAQWASCDPHTLVAAARESLTELPSNQRDQIDGPINEVIARFDQLTRAALGPNTSFVGSGSVAGS